MKATQLYSVRLTIIYFNTAEYLVQNKKFNKISIQIYIKIFFKK